MSVLPAQDVLIHDLPKCLSELPDPVGIDDGIDHGVGVGQDDGDVHHPYVRALTVLAQVVEAVDDVHREPARGEEAHDDGQRLGGVHLLLQGGPGRAGRHRYLTRCGRVADFEAHQPELAPRRHEDVDVDDQHDQQRQQHAAEEIEIDHVVHGDHLFKQALRHALRTSVADGGAVPTWAAKRTVLLLIMSIK